MCIDSWERTLSVQLTLIEVLNLCWQQRLTWTYIKAQVFEFLFELEYLISDCNAKAFWNIKSKSKNV